MAKSLARVPETKEIRKELARMDAALKNPNDNLCVVFTAAFLDKLLGAMLKHVLCKDQHATSEMVLSSGSLSSFGNRVTMSYCLGLITPYCFKNLRTIGDIRNRFAHSIGNITFRDQKIKVLCRLLTEPNVWMLPDTTGDKWPPSTEYMRDLSRLPRNKYVGVANTIGYQLLRDSNTSILDQRRCVLRADDWS
jgi:hypothetical protein